jgi:starch-binding outer membrane protein, SusD/RagB family
MRNSGIVYYKWNIIIFGGLFFLLISSCSKLVEVDPPYTQLTEGNVFNEDAKANAVVTGIYASMNGLYFSGSGSIGMLAGLSSDELTLYSGVTDLRFNAYYSNNLVSNDQEDYGSEFWSGISGLYSYVYKCNASIEGIELSNGLTPAIKKQLLGELKFLRAFFYFYLVSLYDDVPLVLTTDHELNRRLLRTPKMDVFSQIVSDLSEAKELLSDVFLNASLTSMSNERVRPTKWAASSLLSRVYLYMGEWSRADIEASSVINSSLFSLIDINDVFKKNSKETIWQLQPVRQFFNTNEAIAYIIPNTGPSNNTTNPVYLSAELLNSFELGDLRNTSGNWINSRKIGTSTYFYPFKYKLNNQDTSIKSAAQMSEYFMVLRLAEQLLIRAEARAMQGNISGAVTDLNAIRSRARANPSISIPDPLPNYSLPISQSQLLSAILQERKVELFTEWGHRWFDLKRTNNVDAVMTKVTPIKSKGGIIWRSYQQLYPIPYNDIKKVPDLNQNKGY